MKSTRRKTGRKAKPYVSSWGETINGLRHDAKSGRWFIHNGGNFREQDERLAVARFRAWQSEKADVTVELTAHVPPMNMPFNAVSIDAEAPGGFTRKKSKLKTPVDDAELWAYVRQQLITRPAWVAERVGIEQIGYLAELPKPQPTPTLDEVGRFLQQRSESSPQQKEQLRYWWGDFKKFSRKRGVLDLKGIDIDLVFDYANHVKSLGHSPTYTKNWFSGIRTNVNFGRKNGLNPTACRQALDALAVMKPPKKAGKAKPPHPISPKDWHKIYDALPSHRDKTYWLCMLNFAMYPKEASDLDWHEIDLEKGTLITDRDKTDVVRIAVLWKRTINALQELGPKEGGPVFVSARKSRLKRATYAKAYREVRAKAQVSESVKLEDCRDGAEQAAVDGGATYEQAKLLAGHGVGMSDKYIMRKPSAVAHACRAIEAFYFDLHSTESMT